MMRKLLVNALALLAVLAVAGGAMAAVSHEEDKERPAAQAAAKEAQRARQADDTDDADDDLDDDDADDLDDEDLDADDAALNADDGQDADSFGAARSAEVAAYHDCREAAADEAAEDACEKPGPAWENDAHPVFGTDGAKAGEKPGEDHRTEASAQRPERAAKGKAHGKPSR